MRPRRTLAALATTAAVTLTAIAVAPPAASAAPTDLLISEYVEGSSNNKGPAIVDIYEKPAAPPKKPEKPEKQ